MAHYSEPEFSMSHHVLTFSVMDTQKGVMENLNQWLVDGIFTTDQLKLARKAKGDISVFFLNNLLKDWGYSKPNR